MSVSFDQTASLFPFSIPGDRGNPSPASAPSLELQASVRRTGSIVGIRYQLAGDLQSVVVPPGEGKRMDRLWERTCFEAFLGEAGQPFYWELNLSPALDWNLYHFRNYREGMKEEVRISSIRASVESPELRRGFLTVDAELDLAQLLPERTPIDLGLTAVIEERNGAKTYWAIAHAGEKPDFHLRQSFKLRV